MEEGSVEEYKRMVNWSTESKRCQLQMFANKLARRP